MSNEVLGKLLLFVIVPVLALWPYFFIRYKKGVNHFLFVSAVYGAIAVTAMLFAAIALPFGLFLTKLLPDLEALGLGDHLNFLTLVSQTVADWYGILLFPVLYLALPPLIYRRYGVFRLTNAGRATV